MPLTTIQALENGPYKVQGSIRAIDMDGGDVYLCRCGGSQTKPFCDGTHARIGFQAPERAPGHPSAG
jgi:CDGSH-type Zn-finger protein